MGSPTPPHLCSGCRTPRQPLLLGGSQLRVVFHALGPPEKPGASDLEADHLLRPTTAWGTAGLEPKPSRPGRWQAEIPGGGTSGWRAGHPCSGGHVQGPRVDKLPVAPAWGSCVNGSFSASLAPQPYTSQSCHSAHPPSRQPFQPALGSSQRPEAPSWIRPLLGVSTNQGTTSPGTRAHAVRHGWVRGPTEQLSVPPPTGWLTRPRGWLHGGSPAPVPAQPRAHDCGYQLPSLRPSLLMSYPRW